MIDVYKEIAASIIKLAILDAKELQSDNKVLVIRHRKHRKEAIEFIKTKWFDYLCELIGLDPEYARRKVAEK